MTKKLILLTAFSALLFLFSLTASLYFQSSFSQNASSLKFRTVICVDAGHGGIDNGVYGISSGVPEAKINLEIARLLEKDLSRLGFDVVLTRTDDEGLYGDTSKGFKRRDMEKRREIAISNRSDLVISIHCNYSKSKTAKGINVYYDKTDELSTTFADRLCVALAELSSKKVRKDGEKMYITHEIGLPAVIIECGFLSNAEDENKLLSADYKRTLSKAIADCVFEMFTETT